MVINEELIKKQKTCTNRCKLRAFTCQQDRMLNNKKSHGRDDPSLFAYICKIVSSLLSYFGKFSPFSFTFLSPCLSHKRLLSLHTLLRLPAFNVWNDPLVWSVLVTVWLWYPLFNWIFLNVMFPLIYFIFYSVPASFSSRSLWSLFSLVCKKQTYCTLSLGELMLQDTQSC